MPASRRKLRVRIHIMRATVARIGMRYGGSSSNSGTDGPRRTVRPRTAAAARAMIVLNTYIATIRNPCTGNKPNTFEGGNSAAMISVYTGRRAEQVMSGITIMVRKRSRLRSMVRVARMAGMAQAKPDSNGTKARPCRPRARMMRSMR